MSVLCQSQSECRKSGSKGPRPWMSPSIRSRRVVSDSPRVAGRPRNRSAWRSKKTWPAPGSFLKETDRQTLPIPPLRPGGKIGGEPSLAYAPLKRWLGVLEALGTGSEYVCGQEAGGVALSFVTKLPIARAVCLESAASGSVTGCEEGNEDFKQRESQGARALRNLLEPPLFGSRLPLFSSVQVYENVLLCCC